MKREGNKPVNFPGKTDCHPKRGWHNWLEIEMSPRRSRTKNKKEIKKVIDEENNLDYE
jgi:hypothetical protein